MHGLRPCGLDRGKFRGALNHRSEKSPNVCDHRNESNEIAQWNVRRRMTIVGLVFLLRGVAKANLLLIIQPRLVMRPGGHVYDPLDKAPLHTRLVFVVWIAIGTHEPFRKVRLGPDDCAPGIHHGFGLGPKKLNVFSEQPLILTGPSECLLKLSQLFHLKVETLRSAESQTRSPVWIASCFRS